MDREGITYRVIPEYDLVHYFDEATKLFIGAQAITSDDKVVADSGTSNIVSGCHIHKLPIYLFALTLEFSGKGADDQNIYLKKEPESDSGLDYTMLSHSHDIVRLDLVDHIITEKGEIPLDQVLSHVPINPE
jgi:translation initiation factor 2B subunit (eIF-2B alpha/beta/delta family)